MRGKCGEGRGNGGCVPSCSDFYIFAYYAKYAKFGVDLGRFKGYGLGAVHIVLPAAIVLDDALKAREGAWTWIGNATIEGRRTGV